MGNLHREPAARALCISSHVKPLLLQESSLCQSLRASALQTTPADQGPGMCLQVFLNGQRLPIKSFKDYVDLYVKDKEAPRVHERVNDRWEIIICASEGQFQQVRGACSSYASTAKPLYSHIPWLVS